MSIIKRSFTSTVAEHSKFHGSYHWSYERIISLATVPLLASAAIVGPQPIIDLALGVVIPIHCHMGLDCVLVDYLPPRRVGIIGQIATWSLRVGTGLALYGCYQFNTNDIGLTALVQKLWKDNQTQ